MHIFDILEVWLHSMNTVLSMSGIDARFERSPVDRQKTSCCMNLRYNDYEADLLIWESGEAELTAGRVDGEIRNLHFDDVRNPADLSVVLSQMAECVVLSLSK